MTPKSFFLSESIHDYVVAHTSSLDDVARALIDETTALGGIARMQIAPDQGVLLTLLTELVGADHAIEVGTFTGFSALCIARGLRPGGRLTCCDVSEEWTSIGRRYWEQAGLADRIELRLGPALDTLRALPDDVTIDLAFVDADKGNYLAYYDELVPRLRPGGVLLADNVLWGGAIADDANQEHDTVALRQFNDRVVADERMEVVLLTIGDGLTVARRRA